MDFVESLAKERGYKEVTLTSGLTALSFYEKIGYKEVKKQFQRNQLTGILMKKVLL